MQGFDHVACIHYQLHASPQSWILELIVRRRHQDCVEFGKRLARARQQRALGRGDPCSKVASRHVGGATAE